VQLWDISDPRDPRLRRVVEDTVVPVALSPDGRWLVAADASKERLRQWDLLTGEEQRRWPERRGSFVRLAFSADGRMLASTASDGGLVRCWPSSPGNPNACSCSGCQPWNR
jgi:WD40 repeat protein